MIVDLWHYEFMRHALISGMILGPSCGLLGVLVTLRGMAFFSDAVAHSALTGLALGYLLQEVWGSAVPVLWVVLLFSLALSMVMAHFFSRTNLRPDTIIAFSFTGSVALGVVIVSALGKYRLLEGMMFGNIYANTTSDLWAQALLAAGIAVFFAWTCRDYVLAMVQPDLARIQGVPLERLNYLFAALVAVTVTLCLKMVGALLLSGLIVVPPAAAKLLARSFRSMVIWAVSIGLFGAVTGVLVSYVVDLPTGPMIVLVNVACLLLAYLWSRSTFKRRIA